MRTLTRKLLSLLLAFTMVCAMVPAAMAADGEPETTPPTEGPGTPGDTDGDTGDEENPPTETCEHKNLSYESNKDGTHKGVCQSCGETVIEKEDCSAENYTSGTGGPNGNTYQHWKVCDKCKEEIPETRSGCIVKDGSYDGDDTYHWQFCRECNQKIAVYPHDTNAQWVTTDSKEHWKHCNTCDLDFSKATHDFKYDPSQEKNTDGHGAKCVCGATKTVPHDFSKGYTCECGEVNTAFATSVVITEKSFTLGMDKSTTLHATAYSGTNAITNRPITWSSNSRCVSINSSTGQITGNYAGEAKITASADNGSATIYVTVEADADLEVTISEGMGTYYFGDSDTIKGDSLEDQLYDALDDTDYYDYDYEDLTFSITRGSTNIGTLTFPNRDTVDYFGDIEFTIKKADTYTATYTIKDGSRTVLSGDIIINVEEGASAGDIIYPAKSGDDVEFDVNDFEDFWEDKYSKGSLDYVTFGSVSSSRGDLVDADGDKVSSRTKYYADPTSKQADLDGVTFEPGRNTKTTVTIDFTAHGTNNSKRDAELSGTVVILYTEKDPEAIVYSSTGKNITLDADDFLDNYKDTMGSSASNIQIQFLEVPSNGTLYYNYNERTEKGTELTSKNVANYTFSTSSRASRSIEDVTYVPDSRGRSDTVRFACYTSGGDLRYYGEVTFGQTVQNVTVNMTSTSSGVTFQASTFFNADDALLSANTISFGTPSSGTLYKNWNGTSGTRVTASDMFSYVASVTGNASISTVTYVPVAGYSGTVTIPFSAYGAAGGIVSGTVSIRVTATTPTTIFTDVPTTGSQAWAYPFINRLAAAGVVSGVTPTTYGPKQTVKWGEALKMVLLGAGHPAQVEGTGSNWASGYLTYAVNNGIVSNTNINLSSNITRLEMAELAAKALGMSPASRINTGIVGPTDTTNGYVYALYNAGIVGGDSSSGQNRYNGGSTLLRDEMAKIVCGVMDNA